MSCTQCSCLKRGNTEQTKKGFNWEVSSIFEICIWKCNWRHWSHLSHLLIILTCSTRAAPSPTPLKTTEFPHSQKSQKCPVTSNLPSADFNHSPWPHEQPLLSWTPFLSTFYGSDKPKVSQPLCWSHYRMCQCSFGRKCPRLSKPQFLSVSFPAPSFHDL